MDFNFRRDALIGSKIQHFLGLAHTADDGAGDLALLKGQTRRVWAAGSC
jgi:hypothetical protein